MTNTLGLTESFAYDANGNLLSKTTRTGDTISFEYDEADRLMRKTQPRPSVTTVGYDVSEDLVSVAHPDSTLGMMYGPARPARLVRAIHAGLAHASHGLLYRRPERRASLIRRPDFSATLATTNVYDRGQVTSTPETFM